MKELKKEITNGRMLKNNGSWLYCGKCNNTVGYLCYSTYQQFQFHFKCKCGNLGSFSLSYQTEANTMKSNQELLLNKNRWCCPNDESPLFTIVDKNIENSTYKVTCNKCLTEYQNN